MKTIESIRHACVLATIQSTSLGRRRAAMRGAVLVTCWLGAGATNAAGALGGPEGVPAQVRTQPLQALQGGLQTASEREMARLFSALKSRYPGTHFTSVSPSAVPGLYEVVMGHNIALVSARNPRYFIYGRILDTATLQDLTAPRLAQLQGPSQASSSTDHSAHSELDYVAGHEAVVDIASLPLGDAIQTVKGAGSRQLYVFSDPGCGYCKRLQGELAQLDDVTIYAFVVPFQGRDLPQAIWCASDPPAAWEAYMSRGEMTALDGPKDCANPLDRNLALAERLRIQGTPTLVFADGGRIASALPHDDIERRLRVAASTAGQVAQRTAPANRASQASGAMPIPGEAHRSLLAAPASASTSATLKQEP